MEISHREAERGVVIVTVSGRVMLGPESAKIESTVERLLAEGKRALVFDLAGVGHMDSTGIGRFISSLNKVMSAGGEMRMAAASPSVREGFRVTRLDTVFQFFDTVSAACEGFGGR